jgi:rhodanese-related sulfurtransferase
MLDRDSYTINKFSVGKILILGVALGLFIFETQNRVTLRQLFQKNTSLKAVTDISKVRLQSIDLPEALQAFYSPRSVFIDLRARQYYSYGHIENALNIPNEKIPEIDKSTIEKLKKASLVVVYCNGVTCGSSYVAARILTEKGIDNVQVYVNGWDEWRSCRLPITMSDQMKRDISKEKSHERQ